MEHLATEFNGKLARNLEHGQYFEIWVKTTDNPRSFHIALATAKLTTEPNADIGLRVAVQLDGNIVSAITRSGGVEDVKLESKGKDAYQLKDKITINIRICEDCFYIAVNGKRRLKIYHRVEVTSLAAMQIGGDVKSITRVDHRTTYPVIWPPSTDIRFLSFSNDTPKRFLPGNVMVLKGECYGAPTGGFFIQMKDAYSEAQLFLFNPRFDERVVVRNSCINGEYGDEERLGGFPFKLNETFCMGIACQTTELRIAVNGSLFCNFAYRKPSEYPLSRFSGLRVFGDRGPGVRITELDYIQLEERQFDNFVQYTK